MEKRDSDLSLAPVVSSIFLGLGVFVGTGATICLITGTPRTHDIPAAIIGSLVGFGAVFICGLFSLLRKAMLRMQADMENMRAKIEKIESRL